jgi:hypothetical protein
MNDAEMARAPASSERICRAGWRPADLPDVDHMANTILADRPTRNGA